MFKHLLIFLLIACLSTFVLMGCSDDDDDPVGPTIGPLDVIDVTPTSANLIVGQTAQLTAVGKDADGNEIVDLTFAWTSSDTFITKVSSDGLVTAHRLGNTTITATNGDIESSETAITVELVANADAIKIGALIPTSGDYGIQGLNNLSALNKAVIDINAEYTDLEFELEFYDTGTNANMARDGLINLLADDVRCIVGPLTSAELANLSVDINASESILISPSSTVMTLAEDDKIFRAVTSDSVLVDALLKAMVADGVENIAVIYRDGTWGNSINALIDSTAEDNGINYLGAGSYYSPRTSVLEEACFTADNLFDNSQADNFGVVLVCFDEGTPLLRVAMADSFSTTLGAARWYGCDGFANNGYLVSTDSVDVVAEFAASVNFTAPVIGVEENARYTELKEYITAETGNSPGIYPIVTYDAFMLVAKALAEVSTQATVNVLRNRVIADAAVQDAITGDMTFNDNGDRATGDYYFWSVTGSSGNFIWEHTRTYQDGVITTP
jgi:branched-chain amino acid transport system substrate-binding protein